MMYQQEFDLGLDLGPCCACEGSEGVRNVLMLPYRAPTPGHGWGCFQCGLPLDGAVAVICDGCMRGQVEIKHVCTGRPAEGGRTSISLVKGHHFDHDLTRHPEINQWPPPDRRN